MRTCGDCFWFEADRLNGSDKNERALELSGTCYGNPPYAFPGQATHKITGQASLVAVPLRPPVKSSDRACVVFEDKDSDPFAEPPNIDMPESFGGTD